MVILGLCFVVALVAGVALIVGVAGWVLAEVTLLLLEIGREFLLGIVDGIHTRRDRG